MKSLLIIILSVFSLSLHAQSYVSIKDTFYVPTPEYSSSIGVDTLHFPTIITTPDQNKRLPVLILVHGTTPVDKNSCSVKDYKENPASPFRKAKTRLFLDIADSLSQQGIVVLRYDKRSYTVNCIEKKSCWYVDTISPYDYIKDIHYAVDFAKSFPFVDTCNIFLAGHSQGGSFVGSVASTRDDIRGVMCLAPTAQPIDTIVIFQTETVEEDANGASILRQQFDSLRASKWPMEDTLYKQEFSPRLWLDWIQITDSSVSLYKQLDIPTTFMYGSVDKLVPPSIHQKIWMDSIDREHVDFKVFDELDHSFGTVYDSTISSDVLGYMIDWINTHSQSCSLTPYTNLLTPATVSAFPNPVVDYLHLNFPEIVSSVEITDMVGTSRVFQVEQHQVNVKALPPGNYILSIKYREKNYQILFTKL